MALAGWDADQMAAGLEPSLKLAGAAGMDLALTTDIGNRYYEYAWYES